MKDYKLTESTLGKARVIVDILPKGHCVPNRRLNSVGYITIHNTGGMASAKNNHTYMRNINISGERKASWHFTVDEKEIYQAQSTNYEMWHAGDSTGNRNSIGIEICQSNNPKTQEQIYLNAIELVKVLMKYHNISINKVVQHNKWSGKSCPDYLRRKVHGYSWDWFISRCKGTLDTSKPPISNNKYPNGDYDKRARLTSNLNFRRGRGTNHPVVKTVPKGTIVTLGYCKDNWFGTYDVTYTENGTKKPTYCSGDHIEFI